MCGKSKFKSAFNSVLVDAELAQQTLLEAAMVEPVEIYTDGDAILDLLVNSNNYMHDLESHWYQPKFSKILTSSYDTHVNCYRIGSNAITLTTSANITDWTHPDIIMFRRGIFYVFVSKSERINLDQLMRHLSMIHDEVFYIMYNSDHECISDLIRNRL